MERAHHRLRAVLGGHSCGRSSALNRRTPMSERIARLAAVVSLSTCIIAVGAVYALANRFHILADRMDIARVGAAADFDVLRTSIDHLADEIRFSAPADLGHKHTAVRDFIIQS